MSIRLKMALIAMLGTASACIDNVQNQARASIVVSSTAPTVLQAANGVSLTLTNAQLAFGPLYLCASNSAGEDCETARGQWLGSVVIDLLNSAPQEAGKLEGIEGEVRSYMFDLGAASLLTQQDPVLLDAAQALGGNSLRLAGRAQLADGQQVDLTIDMLWAQGDQVEQGVSLIRTPNDAIEPFVLRGEEGTFALDFDPTPWLDIANFDTLIDDASCALDGPEQVCAGSRELRCAADGTVMSETDCALSGQACIRDMGCTDRVSIDEGQVLRVLTQRVVAGVRPTLRWQER